MAQTVLILSIMAVLLISVGVSAKRGCSAFGHSCFGGHGKRSDSSSNYEVSGRLGQDEAPPHPLFPQYGVLAPGDDIIPIRDGGVYERDDSSGRDAAKMKLRAILKYWMDNYRRSRLGADDGYFADAL